MGLTLREEAVDNVMRHYGATIMDEDMSARNNHMIQYYLSYKGKSATSNRPMLLRCNVCHLFLFQPPNNMRFLGHAFNGAKDLYYADWCLQYTAGSARWFPEFTTVDFIALRFILIYLNISLDMIFAVI